MSSLRDVGYNGGSESKMDMSMADSEGDLLHNVIHSMGTDLAVGWITVCYSRNMEIGKFQNTEMICVFL